MLAYLPLCKPVFIYFLKMALCIANNMYSHSYTSSGITQLQNTIFYPTSDVGLQPCVLPTPAHSHSLTLQSSDLLKLTGLFIHYQYSN